MGKRLLLIEDDSFMRDMVALVLQTESYEVDGCGSGEEALGAFSEGGEYAAVISDMYLPDFDGFTLIKKVKELQPDLLFVVLTSETDQAVIEKAADLGIIYIPKDENFAESIIAVLGRLGGGE